MITLGIIVAVLILIAFFRFGVIAEYSADGLIVTAKAGPISIRVFPHETTHEEAEKKAQRKARKEKKLRKNRKKRSRAE